MKVIRFFYNFNNFNKGYKKIYNLSKDIEKKYENKEIKEIEEGIYKLATLEILNILFFLFINIFINPLTYLFSKILKGGLR